MKLAGLARQLGRAQDEGERRGLALELLERSRRREHVDAALRALEGCDLDDAARPLLRARALHYFEETRRDNGALIREQLLRLLLGIGHPDERDLWLRALHCYEIEPMMGEVTQNLRAIGLVGLAIHEAELAQLHALRLLHEPESASRFNSEPALTALNLLAQQEQAQLVYAWLLSSASEALDLALDELVGRALESLGNDFPADLYRPLLEQFARRDRALVSMGLATHIIESRSESLYDALETILIKTRHDELHHYILVLLAGARDDELERRLLALAKLSPPRRRRNFLAALELLPAEPDQELLARLRQPQDS
ncbi:MAG: hypothetical protein OXP68_03525 [Anaerolineaceae bacterium]|nr:hypothetical protein [Anaerolineaceae bacterium]MDE0330193.1 hypothetical protein [Anaerolineaceae bacterium]